MDGRPTSRRPVISASVASGKVVLFSAPAEIPCQVPVPIFSFPLRTILTTSARTDKAAPYSPWSVRQIIRSSDRTEHTRQAFFRCPGRSPSAACRNGDIFVEKSFFLERTLPGSMVHPILRPDRCDLRRSRPIEGTPVPENFLLHSSVLFSRYDFDGDRCQAVALCVFPAPPSYPFAGHPAAWPVAC